MSASITIMDVTPMASTNLTDIILAAVTTNGTASTSVMASLQETLCDPDVSSVGTNLTLTASSPCLQSVTTSLPLHQLVLVASGSAFLCVYAFTIEHV